MEESKAKSNFVQIDNRKEKLMNSLYMFGWLFEETKYNFNDFWHIYISRGKNLGGLEVAIDHAC